MKKIIYSLLGVLSAMFFACSEQVVQENELTLERNKAFKNKGPVFVVEPNGVDDTENLVKAFEDAKAAGPGAVVQLVNGQYTIGMIEVLEFNGFFLGAGKGNTIISDAPDLPCNDYWAVDNCPFLMQFVGGNVTVSDMTFQINDGIPCADPLDNPWRDYFGDMLVTVMIMTDYTLSYVPGDRHIKGVVSNVDFIAGDIEDGFNPYGLTTNTNIAFYGGAPFMNGTGSDPQSNGEITVSGCTIHNAQVGPNFAGFGENATIKIENNVMEGGLYGIFMYCNLGPNITIRNNTIIDEILNDIWIDDNDFGYYPNEVLYKRTEWSISGNKFQPAPGSTSILLSDYRRTVHPDEGFPQLFDIKSNTFIIQDGGIGIMGLNNVDAKIWNNTFKGTGSVGVSLDGDEVTEAYAENNKVVTNNFSKATYTDANVYLGKYTRDCMVVGVATDKVVDEGKDNKIVGVHALKQGPKNWKGHQNPHYPMPFKKNMQSN